MNGLFMRTKRMLTAAACAALCLTAAADVKPFANLPARVFPAAGERLAEAWGLVPGDEPTAIPLDVADIRLPKLEEAAVFLFRFAK